MAVAPAWAEASSTAEEASFCFSVFQIPFAQCQALEALYNATGGPSWTQNSGWLADFEPCGWHGVSCAGSNVVSLSLADNNLVGTIPSEIGGLAGLTAFDLAENSLSGPLPATFGELDNLVALDFSNNQISDLGSGFSGLDALLSAKINDNVLTALPADFNSLTTLQLAFFSRNALDELPDLSGLNNLSTLWVPGNRLEALPAATCSLPALTVLEVGYNRIPLTPSHPCWPLLDAGDTQTQTVSPEIENAFAHPDRPFDDAVVEWTPIDFSQEGGGYRIFMSQTENGEYQLIGQVEDKSVSTFTAKNLSSGERYFFAVETYTDAHGSNPNALVSDRTNPYPLGNSGLPAAARASCLAHINQIGAATGKAQALETVHFHGVVGPLGHIADPSSYRWTYTAADAQCDPIMGSNPVDLPMSRSFATNAIPEGHWRIDFMASENPPPAACLPDFQCLTVLPDRSLTDLEILASEVEIVEPNPPFPPIVGQISPHKQVAIRFTVHNRSAISELTEVRVEAWAGDPDDGGTPIGVVDIPQIGPQGQVMETLPWNVGSQEGFRVVTLRTVYRANVDNQHPDYLDPLHPDYPPYPEADTGNNEATANVLVGTPILGNFDIDVDCAFDLSGNILGQHWAGAPTPLFGDGHYAFGNRLAVMGAEVEIVVSDPSHSNQIVLSQKGRTIAPYGSFRELVTIPDPGTYDVLVRIDDNNLIGEHRFQVTVTAPPPWPNLHFDQHPYYCARNAITFDGPLVWNEGCNYYTVQDAQVDIRALLHNTGFAAADQSEVEVWEGPVGSGSLLTTHPPPGSLPAGDDVSLKIPWPVMAAGNAPGLVPGAITSYNICLDAELITPTDELTLLDNRVCRRLHVLKRAPDLHPTNIHFGPWPVLNPTQAGPLESLEIEADVINMTPIPLDKGCAIPPCSFEVTYYSGQPGAGGTLLLGTQIFTPTPSDLMSRGDRISLPTFVWTPEVADGAEHGWQPVWIVVDTLDPDPNDLIDGEVDEAREYNNGNWSWVCIYKPSASFIRPHALNSTKYGLRIGDTVTLTPYVRNKGELDHLTDVEIDLYLGHPDVSGSVSIGSCTVLPTITGRGTIASCNVGVPWTAGMTPGTVYVYARIQGTLETWARRLDIYADPPPDLQIFSQDIILPAMPPMLNTSIDLKADIRNVSEETDATSFTLRFFSDSPAGTNELGSTVIASLAHTPPGGTPAPLQVMGPSVVITQPYYAFRVVIEPNPLEGDGNFDDNAATSSLAEANLGPQAGFYYPLESQWDPVRNYASNSNNGSAQGGVDNFCGLPAYEHASDPNLNTCLFGQFDGVDDRIVVASAPDMDFTNKLTVMAWARPTPDHLLPQAGDLLARGDRDMSGVLQHGFALGIAGGLPRQWAFTVVTQNGPCAVTGSPILAPLKWESVAATYDGSDLKLYVDGVLVSTQGCMGNIDWGPGGFDFEISPAARPFRGLIDEIRLFDEALDQPVVDSTRKLTRACNCDLVSPIARNLTTSMDYQVDPSLAAVDEPFHPIQRAINEATAGDTVAVRCGNREVPGPTTLKSGVQVIGGFDPTWVRTNCPTDRTTIDGSLGSFRCFEANNVDATALLEEMVVTGCESTTCGGGFYGFNIAMTLNRIIFEGNVADMGGGACFIDANHARIENSTLRDNHAATSGGGLYVSEGSLKVVDVDFDRNTSAMDGGGLATDGLATVLSLNNTVFFENVAMDRGGAAFLNDVTNLTLFNSLVVKNEADTGAGIRSDMFCGTLDIANATVADNINGSTSSPIVDLGVSCAVLPTATLAYLRESIVHHGAFAEMSTSHWDHRYSNFEGAVTGPGNFDQTPIFVGDYYLSPPSMNDPKDHIDDGSVSATVVGLSQGQGYRTVLDADPTKGDVGLVDLGFHHRLPGTSNQLKQTGSSCVARYHLDEQNWRPTGEIRDLSGLHHHGRRVGAANHTHADPASGTSGLGSCGYGSFSAGDGIRVPWDRDLEVGGDFTIAAWVRLKPPTGMSMSMLRHGHGLFGWELAYDGVSWQATSSTGTTAETVFGTQVVQADRWYHVAMVVRGSTLELYVDGALDASVPVSGMGWDPLDPADLRIADSFFVGDLDEIEIHDEALDPADILAMTTAGHGCLSPIFADGFESSSTQYWSYEVQ